MTRFQLPRSLASSVPASVRHQFAVVSTAAIIGLSLVGCSEDASDPGSNEAAIREAAATFLNGIAEGDSEAVCGVLSTGELLKVAVNVGDSGDDLDGTCLENVAQGQPFDPELLTQAADSVGSAELLIDDDAAVIRIPVGAVDGKEETIIKFLLEGGVWTVDGQQ